MNEIKPKKILTFSKMNDIDVLNDIKEYFEMPEKYFQEKDNFFVGTAKLRQYKEILDSKENDNNNKNIKPNEPLQINNISAIKNSSFNQKETSNKQYSRTGTTNNAMSGKKQIENLLGINKIPLKSCICPGKNCVTETTNKNIKFTEMLNVLNTGNTFKEQQAKKQCNISKISKISKRNSKFFADKRPQSVGIHYNYKTPQEIVETYTEGKEREKEGIIKGTNNLIPDKVIHDIKDKYVFQEKKLTKQNLRDIQEKKISNYLAKKCRNKEENLLYNNTDNFRIKKQLIEYLENNKTLTEKFGNSFWYVNLRRPNVLKRYRDTFINVGKRDKEIWHTVMDVPERNLEIIDSRKHIGHQINFEKFLRKNEIYSPLINTKNNKSCKSGKLKNSIPNINNLDQIRITGKNMISFEKDNFLSFKKDIDGFNHRKFRVFRDPREDLEKNRNECLFELNYQYEGRPNRVCYSARKKNKKSNSAARIKRVKFSSDKNKTKNKKVEV